MQTPGIGVSSAPVCIIEIETASHPMTASAPVSSSSTQGAGPALQERMELFARVLSVITVIAFLLGLVGDLAGGNVSRLSTPLYGTNVGGTLLMVGFWAVCRFVKLEPRNLLRLETVVLILSSAIFGFGGRYLNESVLNDMAGDIPWRTTAASSLVAGLIQHYMSLTVAISLTQAMTLRAAIVPSSARRTLWLTAAVGLPVVLINGIGLCPFHADFAIRQITRPHEGFVIAVIVVIWWAFTTLVCVVISRVIYALRIEVRQARQLGQYTLEEKLGAGGMGEVYRASHAMLRRPTAVKLLPPDRAEPAALARFEREVQLTSQLSHPNTITLFDYGRTPDGIFYYAMELLDGATLGDIVEAEGPLPSERVIHVLRMVAGSLSEAHQLGLVHRDIKPANIMLCERGGEPDIAKVLDFGLVKPVHAETDSSLTQANAITGTPLYMSPESISSPDTMDGRSDLYSLGAVGYFMLTGKHLFEARTVIEICGHHLHTRPVPPSERINTPIAPDLEQIVLRCLEKDPAQRPQSAAELRAALDRCRDAEAWTSQRACAWWRGAGDRLRSRKTTVPMALGSTLAVAHDQLGPAGKPGGGATTLPAA